MSRKTKICIQYAPKKRHFPHMARIYGMDGIGCRLDAMRLGKDEETRSLVYLLDRVELLFCFLTALTSTSSSE